MEWGENPFKKFGKVGSFPLWRKSWAKLLLNHFKSQEKGVLSIAWVYVMQGLGIFLCLIDSDILNIIIHSWREDDSCLFAVHINWLQMTEPIF